MKMYKIDEVCQIIGVKDEIILKLVHKEWIQPASAQDNEFDEEDLTRIRLILELMSNMEVNEEAVPIILNLVDQIHFLHFELQKYKINS